MSCESAGRICEPVPAGAAGIDSQLHPFLGQICKTAAQRKPEILAFVIVYWRRAPGIHNYIGDG